MITDQQRTELKKRIDELVIAWSDLHRKSGEYALSRTLRENEDRLFSLAKRCDKLQGKLNQWIDKEL